MPLTKQSTLILTWLCLGCWAIFGALFGWSIKELDRLDPFYTPLECTNVYFIAAKPAAAASLVVTDYSAEMECTNKNQIKFDFGTASKGDVLYVNADDSTKDIGDVKLPTAASMDKDAQNVKMKLTLSMTMSAADLTAAGTAMQAQATANVSIPAVPFLFTFKPDVKLDASYMFSGMTDTNFIPKKYCGFLIQSLAAGTHGGVAMPNGALKSVSVTTCADSQADAITAIKALSKDGGPSSANDHSAGYISSLDPPADYLAEKEGDAMVTMGILTRLFAILSMGGVGMAMTCATLWYRLKGSS